MSNSSRSTSAIKTPRCKLLGRRLTEALPHGCPLLSARAFAEINTRMTRAYAIMHERPADGLRMLDAGKTCGDCIPDALRDPGVRALRSAAQAKGAPA